MANYCLSSHRRSHWSMAQPRRAFKRSLFPGGDWTTVGSWRSGFNGTLGNSQATESWISLT